MKNYQITKEDIKTMKVADDLFIRHENGQTQICCNKKVMRGRFEELQEIRIDCDFNFDNGDASYTLSNGQRPEIKEGYVNLGGYCDHNYQTKTIIDILKPGDMLEIRWYANMYYVAKDETRDTNIDQARFIIRRPSKRLEFILDCTIRDKRRSTPSYMIHLESEPQYSFTTA